MVLTIRRAEDERGHVDRSAGIGQREDQEQGAHRARQSRRQAPHHRFRREHRRPRTVGSQLKMKIMIRGTTTATMK